jgi:hypothetical protein
MKTSFLFGLVSFVIIATVAGVIEAFKGDPIGFIVLIGFCAAYAVILGLIGALVWLGRKADV